MTGEKKRTFTRRITQANKTQLITILYEMTLEYLQTARDLFEKGDVAGFDRQLNYAQECINELIHSLHLEYALAQHFLQLYLYAKRELIAAMSRRETEPVEVVERMFYSLWETYVALEKMDTGAAQMKGAPSIYAGLTYGKGMLNESVGMMAQSRGFTA